MTAFSDTASIERCIIELLASRKPESSICPSDAARALWPNGEQWRDRMDDVRAAAAGLARRGEQHFRELPVAGRVGGTAVNGYIDLLYKEGEHWVIADYKTDVYAHRTRVESYFTQLELYARLLGDALGGPVARLELIFSDGDGDQVVTHLRG